NDPASHLYVNLKTKAAAQTGLRVTKILLPKTTSQIDLLKIINNLNNQNDLDGILVQLPLPKQIDESTVIQAIKPEKDADGFHPTNINKFLNKQSPNMPGLIEGILKLINLSSKNLNNKSACLLVNSPEFGQPLSRALKDIGLKTEIHKNKANDCLAQADLVVTALGNPHYLNLTDFKNDAVIIDVGTTKRQGRVLGDVNPSNPNNKPVFLTPVPGGVGPVTVAMLLWSVYRLAIKNNPSIS
ncbi:MAG: tetrahydrofolate dehydrogenase/cyclohydrolase catalytic domain-containing protein, partial [Patescibacteria group bacterium]